MHSAGRSWLPGGEEMAPGRKHLALPGAAGPHRTGLTGGKPPVWGGYVAGIASPSPKAAPLRAAPQTAASASTSPCTQRGSGALPRRFPTNHSDCSDFISLLPGEEHVFLATGEPAAVRSSNFGRMVPQDGMLPRDGWPSGLTNGPQYQQGFGTGSASPHGRSSGIVAAQGTQHAAGSPRAKQNSPAPSLHPHFGCCLATSSFADHQLPQLRPDPPSAPAGQAVFPRKHSRAARWLQCSLAIFGPTLQGNPNQKATTATLSFGFACCTHTHTHSALPSRAQRGHPLPHTVGRSGLSRPRAEQPLRSSPPPSLRAEGSRARGGQAEGGRELENTFI